MKTRVKKQIRRICENIGGKQCKFEVFSNLQPKTIICDNSSKKKKANLKKFERIKQVRLFKRKRA